MSVEGRTNKAPALFFYHADVKIAVFLSIFAMTIYFRFPQNRPCKAVWGIFLFIHYSSYIIQLSQVQIACVSEVTVRPERAAST